MANPFALRLLLLSILVGAFALGGDCGRWKPYRLKRVEPSPEDIPSLREIMHRKIWPAWAATCDRIRPDCSREWQEKVGPFAAIDSSSP